MSSLTFNGTTAASMGLRIGGVNTYDAQEREVQLYTVPGRTGAVYPALDLSQIPNEVREYNAALYLRANSAENVERRMAAIRDWLMNTGGYAELSDSYEPDVYRRAFFVGNFAPVRKGAGQNFEIPLRFSCDPRRFLTGNNNFSVDGTTTYTTPSRVNNFKIREASKPLMFVSKGAGIMSATFTDVTVVNGSPRNQQIGKVEFSATEENFWFDAETLTAYLDDVNRTPCNNMIADVTGEIRLGPGPTKISFDSALLSINFNPRWWIR